MDHFLWFIFVQVLLDSTFCSRGAEDSVSVSEGQDCVLPCSGREGVRVLALEWTRLDQDRNLLVFREGKVLNEHEHPDFMNRVQLLDPHLQSGVLSVVLKNVTLKDSGTYECWAQYEDKQKIFQFIRLNVTEPETPTPTTGTDRTEGLGTGGVIAIVIGLILLIGFILYLKRFQRSQVPSHETSTSSTTSSNLSNGSCMKPLIKDGPPASPTLPGRPPTAPPPPPRAATVPRWRGL